MDTVTLVLLLGIFIAVIANSVIQQQRYRQILGNTPDAAAIAGHIAPTIKVPTTADMVGALSGALTEAEISEKIGAFTALSSQMTDATIKFNQMVEKKSKRANWGEWHLEEELKEAFPNVKIRSAVKELGNLKPDAHIRTPDGKILIVDSKFVYDTYNEIQAAPSTEGVGEKTVERLNTQLRNEVKGHVNKIRSDYVHPGKGTHEVAYMYIPSMAVYEYLIEHESATVRWAASQGVVICSPVNLMANMYMLEIVRMAQNMASLHNEILDAHLRVQKSFQAFEVEYKRLNTHIDNAFNKKTDLTGLVTKMDSEIRGLSSLAKSIESGSSGQSPKLNSVDGPGEHSADKQLA